MQDLGAQRLRDMDETGIDVQLLMLTSPGVQVDLEGLEQLVAAMLVHGQLVGDLHPVGALELLHVEDLGVELGRVVDDDQHLGLGIEVGPRPIAQFLELEAAWIGHGAGA